jgi:hypothetical protein
MKLLKQSTAATIVVGPVLDASGAAVTTAVVGDFRLAKNGTTATLSGATVTHDANGYYTIALTTTNTDTVGRLVVYSGNTAQSMATHHWTVLLASVFDAIQANATNATGGLVTATAAVTAMAGAISTLTAAGVRAELATELARIDLAISSRMATYTQPIGFLAATFPATVSSYAGGAVASVTAAVTVGTNADKTGYSLTTAPPTAAAIADAVWDEIMSTHTINGSYGSHVVRSANQNQNTVSITGSQHVAADVHAFQAAVIDSAAFASNWLTAAGTAADYITELQAAIGTLANQTTILDRQGYALAILAGTISDAQTAAETYAITLGANTFTVDFAGLDSSGNRTGQTLTKV